MAETPKLTAKYQRQEWIDDFMIPMGQPVEFDVAAVLATLPPRELHRVDGEIRKPSGRRDLAVLAKGAGIDGDWDGPFEVVVDRAAYHAWLPGSGLDPQGFEDVPSAPSP